MSKFMPAVHNNKNKRATARFWHRGEFKSLTLHHPIDRKQVLSHIKSYYPGATKISVVFFVPHAEEKNEKP